MVGVKFYIAHSKYITIADVCNFSHANKHGKMRLYEVAESPRSMHALVEFD